jgi:hypothetical protein
MSIPLCPYLVQVPLLDFGKRRMRGGSSSYSFLVTALYYFRTEPLRYRSAITAGERLRREQKLPEEKNKKFKSVELAIVIFMNFLN